MASFYGTVAAYKTWATDRLTSYAAYSDAQITAALVRASYYIDGTYRDQFPGLRKFGRSQDLEWPRFAALDRNGFAVSDTVPVEIEYAAYEGAKRELAAPNSLAPDIKPGGGVLKRVKAGSVEVEYEANNQTTATFQAIEQTLGPLLIVRSRYSGGALRA